MTLNNPPRPPAPASAENPYRYRPLAVSGADFEALRDLIDTLLAETGGCPWDKEQSLQSLLQLFPMEVAEVREAAQNGDRTRVMDELGDCFMLLLLLLAKAQNTPGADGSAPTDARQAIDLVRAKIISRHTWIFGADTAASPEEVERLWEQNKQREKAAEAGSGTAPVPSGSSPA